jgi:SNF2 family DNA or RNA helicase
MQTLSSLEGMERRGLIFKLMTALKQICNHPVHYTGQGRLKPDHSGKALKTVELVQALLDNNEKALIFTQYKQMGDLLTQLFESA